MFHPLVLGFVAIGIKVVVLVLFNITMNHSIV